MKIPVTGLMSDGSIAPHEIMSQIVWRIEDPTIASIENGIIKPLKNGKTLLIGTINGIKTSVEINIVAPGIRSIGLDISTVNINLGGIIDIDT